jgi:hypothetical protein
MFKERITLGRMSDKEDVKNALRRRTDLNIREVTSINEVFANGGGIYSSDDLYELLVFDVETSVFLGSERFRAKNIREAQEMGEEYEDKYKKKYRENLRFKVQLAPSMFQEKGGLMANGGGVKNADTKRIIESISEIRYDLLPPIKERTMSTSAYQKILLDATKKAIKDLYRNEYYDLHDIQKATREAGGVYNKAFVALYGEKLTYANGGGVDSEITLYKVVGYYKASDFDNKTNGFVIADDYITKRQAENTMYEWKRKKTYPYIEIKEYKGKDPYKKFANGGGISGIEDIIRG